MIALLDNTVLFSFHLWFRYKSSGTCPSHTDPQALITSRAPIANWALTHLENTNLLRRSEQWRGPGVYYPNFAHYTLFVENDETAQVTPQITDQTTKELPRLMAEGKRLSRQEMQDVVVALCTERPQTARESAQKLHRNAKYLRDAYLSPLVREGKLELTGAANDPNVAYCVPGLSGKASSY